MGGSITRRRFIGRAGAAVAGAALVSVPGLALAKLPTERKVYRLSTRGHSACNACKGHAANRYYFNADAVTRPHRGCNCSVLEQWIPVTTHREYFGSPPGRPRKVFDRRWRG